MNNRFLNVQGTGKFLSKRTIFFFGYGEDWSIIFKQKVKI